MGITEKIIESGCEAFRNRRQLVCHVMPEISVKIIDEIGCPAVVFKVINKGRSPQKLSQVQIRARGRGFIDEISKGFALGEIPRDGRIDRDEIIWVRCIPLDEPTRRVHWLLEPNDACHFAYPAGFGTSHLFSTMLADDLNVVAVLVNDEICELVDGDQFQTVLQPIVDYVIQHKLVCKETVSVGVIATYDHFPAIGVVGGTNALPISIMSAEPSFGSGQEFNWTEIVDQLDPWESDVKFESIVSAGDLVIESKTVCISSSAMMSVECFQDEVF